MQVFKQDYTEWLQQANDEMNKDNSKGMIFSALSTAWIIHQYFGFMGYFANDKNRIIMEMYYVGVPTRFLVSFNDFLGTQFSCSPLIVGGVYGKVVFWF